MILHFRHRGDNLGVEVMKDEKGKNSNPTFFARLLPLEGIQQHDEA